MARRRMFEDGKRLDTGLPVPPSDQFFADAERKTERGKKKRPVFDAARMRVRMKEADAMRESGEWGGASAQHFVALFSILHAKVYGVPSEFSNDDRNKAAFMAAKLLRENFDGDSTRFADFMRDVWTKEFEREKWRRENQREGGRITWYKMFSGATFTEWRINRLRKGKS